jgi:hypothetical protein
MVNGKLSIVLFGFSKYINSLTIIILFRYYKQTIERNCVFCIWSDKITKRCWYNRNTGGKVAVIRKECKTYTTVVVTSFEYSVMCGKCWTTIFCVFYKYKKITHWYFNPESSSNTWHYMWNTIYIIFQSLKSILCSEKRKSRRHQVSLRLRLLL